MPNKNEVVSNGHSVETNELIKELMRDRDSAIRLLYQSEREKGEFKDFDFAALFAIKDQLEEFKVEKL